MRRSLVTAVVWLAPLLSARPAGADPAVLDLAGAAKPLLEVEARFRLGVLPLDRLAPLDVIVRNTGRAPAEGALVEVMPPVRGFAGGAAGPPLASRRLGRIAPGAAVRSTLEVDVRGLRPGTACFPVRVRRSVPRAGREGTVPGSVAAGLATTRACVTLHADAGAVMGGGTPPAAGEHVVEVRSVTVLGTRERDAGDVPVLSEAGLRVRVRIEARRVRGGPVPPLEVEVVETPQGGGARVAARYRTPPLMVAGGWDQREVAVTPGGLGLRCFGVRVRPAPRVRVLPRAAPACVVVAPARARLPAGLSVMLVPRDMPPEAVWSGMVAGRVRAGEPVALDLLAKNDGPARSPAMTVRVVSLMASAGPGESAFRHMRAVRVPVPALAPGERRRVPFEFRFAAGGGRRCLVPAVTGARVGRSFAAFPLCYAVEGPAPAEPAGGEGLRDCPPGAPPSSCRGPARAYRLRDGTVVDALRLSVRPLGVEPAGAGRYRVRARARLWTTGADPVEDVVLEVLAPEGRPGLLARRRLERPLRPREAARVVTVELELAAAPAGCLRVRAFGTVPFPGGRRLPAATGVERLCPRVTLGREALREGLDPARAVGGVRDARPRVSRIRLTRRSVADGLVRYLGTVIELRPPRARTGDARAHGFEVGVRRRDGRVHLRYRGRLADGVRGGRRVELGLEEQPVGYGDCVVVRFEGEPWPLPGAPASRCVPQPPHFFVTVALNGFSASFGEARPGLRVRPCIEARAGGRGTKACAGRSYPLPRGGGWLGVRRSELPRVTVAVPRAGTLAVRLFLQGSDGRIVHERRELLAGPPFTWVGGRHRYRTTPDGTFLWGIARVEDPAVAGRGGGRRGPVRPEALPPDPSLLRDLMGLGR